MFLFTASAHFTGLRHDLVRMVPPQVPWPDAVVFLTGVLEALGAVGILVRRTRRIASRALVAFLIAVLPANIYAAQSGVTLGGAPVTPLAWRVPMQVLFVLLVWWTTQNERKQNPQP